MKLRNHIILLVALILLGCNEDKKRATDQDEKEIVESKTDKMSQLIDNSIKIAFKEFVIEMDSIAVWDEEGKLKEQQKDTARVYLELGETIEGQTLKIQEVKKGTIRIYQRYENSVTVMNEGPHCDLTEWKHYNSDWKELEINNGKFLTDSYSEADRDRFIEVDMNELREALRVQCGDDWAEYVKDAKSPNDPPCDVGISRIFLKITFSEQGAGEAIERIVSFEIQMGC